MVFRFGLADVHWLRSDAGAQALAAGTELELAEDTLIADLTRLRRAAGGFAGAVVETVRLRRRAVPKLGESAARWLFTDEALQQSSPAPVAFHRARRLADHRVHDLTCSIGGDLVALAAACPLAVGSDVDPVRVSMAAHNLASSGLPARVVIADALTVTTRDVLPYADPARRDHTGRRITSEATLPSIADLDRVHAARPPVLRVPPGIDYPSLARPGEVEIVSLDGTAREAVLWPPELARVPRRATVLRSAATDTAPERVTSDEPDDVQVTLIQEYLVDPDPAIVRAHLVRQWAARHGLSLLDPHLAYLTGPRPPPHLRAFRVLDAAPYRERTIVEWCRRSGIGTLEIKQRGTPVVPDELRRRLRPALRGPKYRAATLVIARVGRDAQAYWCDAVRPGEAPTETLSG